MPTVLGVVLIVLLDGPLPLAKPVPPLGRLLSPFHGFWVNAHADADHLDLNLSVGEGGLRAPVTVRFDDRLVPHVFAQNDHDLYVAQGYLHARFRLWQMDLQSRAAAGELAELLGDKFIRYDKFKRRSGMLEAARRTVEAFQADSQTKAVLEAYTAGINAYVASLSPRDLPVEYKLMNFRPRAWSPVRTALMLKLMCWDLAATDSDLPLTLAAQKYGLSVAENLYPNYLPYQDPIIPTPKNGWGFKPVSIPVPPRLIWDTASVHSGGLATAETPTHHRSDPVDAEVRAYIRDFLGFGNRHDKSIGSNNWAVSGDKTRSGYPILADDPHLGLSLPSIWYEMQLVSPTVNVYGVSLPGAPSIIIGYNQKVAWGVTNVGSDVMDWYRVKFRGTAHDAYWHGKEWKPVRKVIEEIRLKDGRVLLDTVLYTHHGPVVFPTADDLVEPFYPVGCALKWLAHEPSNELQTLMRLNRAENYTDYTEALRTWVCPAQNFVYADVRKNIALWCNGKFPLKWKGQGKYILDGTDPTHDWQGYIPQNQNPNVRNPERGFVSSANQHSADTTYPYYLDWDQESFERGARINQRLAAMQGATPDSLRELQNDNYNLLGRLVLPKVGAILRRLPLKDDYATTAHHLLTWDYHNDPNSVGASVFYLFWDRLEYALWDDDLPLSAFTYPDRSRTAQLLLTDSTSRWYDDARTPGVVETRAQIIQRALILAHDSLKKRFPNPQDWVWYKVKNTNIRHLARIPGLGTGVLNIGGGRGIVNATREHNGPSWRMVVSVVPSQVRGYGIYPGGQSGEPGSKYYDNFLPTWLQGQLAPLLYLKDPNETHKRLTFSWGLTP